MFNTKNIAWLHLMCVLAIAGSVVLTPVAQAARVLGGVGNACPTADRCDTGASDNNTVSPPIDPPPLQPPAPNTITLNHAKSQCTIKSCIPAEDIRKDLKVAQDYWSKHSPKRLKAASCKPNNVKIMYYYFNDNGVARAARGGANSTMASSYKPYFCKIFFNQYYWDKTSWDRNKAYECKVMVHEYGHLLGYSHDFRNPQNVMFTHTKGNIDVTPRNYDQYTKQQITTSGCFKAYGLSDRYN